MSQRIEQSEHIIADGGSDDGTIGILKQYPHLRWISEPDRGQANAVNKAVDMARGEIIGWLNTDDIYPNEALRRVVDYFDNNPEAHILVGDCLFFYEGIDRQMRIKNRTLGFEDLIRYWDPAMPPAQPSVFFRKNVFTEAGGLDETLDLALDYDLWLRAARKNRFHYISEILSAYRFHGKSKSGIGEDWSQFYPEWHGVYYRYKKYSEQLENRPIITFAIAAHPDTDIEEINRMLRTIAGFRLRDIEVMIISTTERFETEEFLFPVKQVATAVPEASQFENIIRSDAEGMFITVLSTKFIPPENWFYLSINHLLDNPDKKYIEEPRLKDIPFQWRDSDFVPHRIVRHSGKTEHTSNSEKIFSVIIPTYNRSEVLIKCLDALCGQSFAAENFEVIVIDDGSTDDTQKKIARYDATYELKYIHQENSGPAAARNKGIDAARGIYILIINDDTIAAPDLLERHLEAQNKNAGKKLAVLGTFDYLPDARRRPFVNFMQITPMVFAYPVMKAGEIYPYRFFWTCNISIERSALVEAGKFDENFSDPMIEDTEIGWRLEKMGWQVLYYPEAKSLHHHSINITQFAKRQWMSGKNTVKLVRKHPELLKKEKELFGFDNLEKKQINFFKNYIRRLENAIPGIIEDVRRIDRFDVIDGEYVAAQNGKKIPIKQINKGIQQASWHVHYYNFYRGIIEKTEEENAAENPPEYAPLPDLSHVRTDTGPAILFTMYGWDESGGGTLFPRSVALEFSRRGWRVGIFYAIKNPDKNKPKFYMDISRDGDIELFGLGNRSTFFSDPDYPLREIDNPPAVDRFRHVMDAFLPDIVHYHNFLGFSLSIADIVKKSGIPSCFTPHNYHLIDPSLYMFRYDKMRSWQNADFFENSDLPLLMPEKSGEYQERISAAQDMLNNKIDLTLAISTKVRDIFAEFGVDRKKMSVVHQMPKYINSIEKISHDKPSRGDKLRIGYLGAVIAHKGAHLLISAAQYLDTSRTECLLFGEINEIYHREIVKLDKKNICHFEGEYSVGDLPEIGRKLDLVVVPSIWQEGAGLVVAESLAMGLPVVAADIGGIPDFVCDGQNGRLFDPERPETLARILVEVQENPGLIEKWHNNCKIPHHFNDYINNIEKLYNELKSDGDIIANEYDLLFKC